MSQINKYITYSSHYPASNHCHISTLRMVASYWQSKLYGRSCIQNVNIGDYEIERILNLHRKYWTFDTLFKDVNKISNFFGMRKVVHLSGKDCSFDNLVMLVKRSPTIVMGRQDFVNYYDFVPEVRINKRVGHFVLFHTVLSKGCFLVDNPYEPITDDRYFSFEYIPVAESINGDKGEDWICTKDYLLNKYWDEPECAHIMIFAPCRE